MTDDGGLLAVFKNLFLRRLAGAGWFDESFAGAGL
jgi:hypothetical protein